MNHLRHYLLAGVLLLVPCAQGADPVTATQPTRIELAPAYSDGSFGFSIAPPVASDVRRQKRMSSVSDVEVVQFANEMQRWSLTVRVVTTTTESIAPQAIVEGITSNLAQDYEDVKVLRGEEVRIDAREGLRYAASFAADGVGWLRQQAVIRTKPTEYYALVFITSLQDKEWAGRVFDKVVDSFRILRTPAMTRRIEEALENGRLLLESTGDGKVKLSERIFPESYLRFVLDGKDLGTVQVSERAVVHKGHPGVQIYELGWLFNDNQTITNLQHDMHLTDDLTFEKWENRVFTLTPHSQTEARQLLFQLDSGLRQDRKLIAAFMAKPNAPELQDRVIEVAPTYASAAWHSLLPRVINLRRPQLYAFSTYNAERRGMVLRTVEVVGPAQITVAGRMVQAFKLQDSEGLIPPITEIYVDQNGRILRVVAGALEMIAANKQDVLQLFGKRIAEAEATMKKYPVQRPEPARRDPDALPGAARTPRAPGGRP